MLRDRKMTTYGVFRGEIESPKISWEYRKRGKEGKREREGRRGDRCVIQKRKRTPDIVGTCAWAVSTGGAQVPRDFDAVNHTRLIKKREKGGF